jgi:hypothetical protein
MADPKRDAAPGPSLSTNSSGLGSGAYESSGLSLYVEARAKGADRGGKPDAPAPDGPKTSKLPSLSGRPEVARKADVTPILLGQMMPVLPPGGA